MTAEIRITRKGIIFFLVLNIILMYIISGKGCQKPSDINQKNSIIRHEPVTQQTSQSISGQGRLKEKTNIVEDHNTNDNVNIPTIYAITPTYARPLQKAELTRISQTIMLVPNIFWVVVEDADSTSNLVKNLLTRNGLEKRSVQLSAKTPVDFKLKEKDPNWSKPRGVEQRNVALEYVRTEFAKRPQHHSIVYFMDDDNSYSIHLFSEMAKIQRGRVGVWPVGLVGGLKVEKPVLDENGIVTGFNAAWRPDRPFPVDMAGFAISGDLLLRFPEAIFSYDVQRGFQESEILRQITTIKELQPLANNCTDVLVWHTRTEIPKFSAETNLIKSGKKPSDLNMEV